MLMRDIMDLIDPDKMTIKLFRNIIDKLDRGGDNLTTDEKVRMYSTSTEDEIEEAKLEKLRAEISKNNAMAQKERDMSRDYYGKNPNP